LGWGAVTLSRYENGALQDEAHDKTLHLAMLPENLIRLLEAAPTLFTAERQYELIQSLNGTPTLAEKLLIRPPHQVQSPRDLRETWPPPRKVLIHIPTPPEYAEMAA
jgi:hypothetical protein